MNVAVKRTLICFTMMIVGAYVYINHSRFDFDKIVKNSILKDRTFVTNVVEITSPKGIKAYLFEDNSNPIISIDFLFKNVGRAYDKKGEMGISNMVSALLDKGAGSLDANAFREELEMKAIGLSFDANLDDFKGSLVTTRDNREKAYEMLNMSLTKPRFDTDEIKYAKDKFVFALKNQFENPQGELSVKSTEDIFVNHPYGDNFVGVKSDIERVSKKDLQNFVRNRLTLDRLLVGISGDISEDEAGKVLDVIFFGLEDKNDSREIALADIDFDGRNVHIERETAQNSSVFANQGVDRNDIDFYPLYIVNHIFGASGLSSRLSLKAREDEALTYGIYTYLSMGEKSNLIKGGFSSTPNNHARVVEIVKEEWEKLGKNGVSPKELDLAKDFLISSYNLRFASIANISNILIYMQRDKLGIDFLKKRNEYVANVNIDDVNRVARKYFDNDNMIFVSIGTFDNE